MSQFSPNTMEPDSIDAVMVGSGEATPVSPRSLQFEGAPNDAPPKLKGRKRLLHSLQRMSSSPSLARMRGTSSSGYRSGGLGSISCVSLSGSYGSSYASEMSAAFSTAPTSAVGTPGPDASTFDHKARVRAVGLESPTSVPLPAEFRPVSRIGTRPVITETNEDYFSRPVSQVKEVQRRENFNFWADMPPEIRMEILTYLKPKHIVRCSSVSKSWHRMCFDGQLWSNLDTSEFYRDIPAEALVKLITSAGPFVRDLNLRGCVQLREQWSARGLADACKNLENFSIEGCRIDRTTIHCFLLQNNRLVHINLSGLAGATNSGLKIIAQHCPKVEHLNVSWCNNIDTRGIKKVIEGCPNLRDLRAGEVRGWEDIDLMVEIFKRNTLESLILNHCDGLNDEALTALVCGVNPEIDFLTGNPMVPPRRLKHLDLTRCRGVTDAGVKALAHNVPFLEGLQLSKCHGLSDTSLTVLLPTLPLLTHLDLEELESLTNATLQSLANAPCRSYLKHLSISYCENLGDTGMLPVLKSCTKLQTLDMDNTRISDLVLTEAAAVMMARNRAAAAASTLARNNAANPAPIQRTKIRPTAGLRIVAYDCANVTWTGVREILSRNAEIVRTAQNQQHPASYKPTIIQLKCFYNYQPTVEEHTKRVMVGNHVAATRLERKWAEWMMLNEEAGVGGAGGRRRRRRAREARELFADEEEGAQAGAGGTVGGRRRRARSGPGGCTVM